MPNLSNTVTFLFASDGSLASEGLSVFLQTKSNFLMISECSDGASTVADIEAHSPQIAVIDAQFPDMSAGQIIEAVRTKNQETRIIVLGATADRNLADRLLAAGADAYVVRNGPSRHLNDAIRYVRDGGKYLAPQLTKDVPVAAESGSESDQGEAVVSLRKAVEEQARTVERLEQAMDRTQSAIELLQQKVEQLTGGTNDTQSPSQPSSPQSGESERNRKTPGLRAKVGAVAAAMMVGVLGFMLAGILRPAPESAIAEFSSAGAEDALKAGTTSSLHLAGWEIESVEKAAALLKNQEYLAAEKLCRTLLKQNPSNTAASRVLASALFHQDRIEESADVVRSMAVPATRAIRRTGSKLSFDN
jgi:DNA-binding NarL/FixJ family response regulator